MSCRDLPFDDKLPSLTLRTRPYWTAIFFFGFLSALHAVNGLSSVWLGRGEGYGSVGLAAFFAVVAFVCHRVRIETSFIPAEQRIRIRTGTRRIARQRDIAFEDVRGVRLTMAGMWGASESRLEVLTNLGDIECPPTSIPRQQALYLAITMDVPLVKVCNDEADVPKTNVQRMNRVEML